jgi:hypothetical protein
MVAPTGLGLEEGDYPGTQYDSDPLFAGSILKVDTESGAGKIGLGYNGGVIRGLRRRFFVHFFTPSHENHMNYGFPIRSTGLIVSPLRESVIARLMSAKG